MPTWTVTGTPSRHAAASTLRSLVRIRTLRRWSPDRFAQAQAGRGAARITSFSSPVSRHRPNSPVRM